MRSKLEKLIKEVEAEPVTKRNTLILQGLRHTMTWVLDVQDDMDELRKCDSCGRYLPLCICGFDGTNVA